MEKKSVLYLVFCATPYRSAFFQALAKDVELTVLYEQRDSLERQWVVAPADESLLREITLKAWKKKHNRAFCPEVIKYLKQDYDHIVIGGYSTPTGMLAILWLKLHRKKFFLNADGGMEKQSSGLREKLKRFFISAATYWLSSGNRTTRYLQYYGAAKERIFQYPFTSLSDKDILPAPTSRETKKALREKLGLPVDQKITIAVGQFIHRKGFDVLIEAWKSLPEDALLLVVGGGPLRPEYEQNKGSNVMLIDFLQKEELAQYYRAADLFVLPTREDIWGLVVNEAMGYGLPVITTDRCVSGLELVKNGENGYIVPAGDAQTLADRTRQILDNDALREQMAQNTLETIRAYTVENMAKIHMEVFRKLLEG